MKIFLNNITFFLQYKVKSRDKHGPNMLQTISKCTSFLKNLIIIWEHVFSPLCSCYSGWGEMWLGTSCRNVVIKAWTDVSISERRKWSVCNKWLLSDAMVGLVSLVMMSGTCSILHNDKIERLNKPTEKFL